MNKQSAAGLCRPGDDRDSCGIGAVVDIRGKKSHQTLRDALTIVEHLGHRAGTDADGETGDGVGILLQISHRFFSKACARLGLRLGKPGDYGIGMFFFEAGSPCVSEKLRFEQACTQEGIPFLGWRLVPVAAEILGQRARSCMPQIWQAFVGRPQTAAPGEAFERRLYLLRRTFEKQESGTAVVSLSSRTIVYKGMLLVGQLRSFYRDLTDPDYQTAIAMVHSRFSTNTTPSWMRAHPNRMLLHNGEINTILGNADKMLTRQEVLCGGALGDEISRAFPIVNTQGSDSAMLDNALEFLAMSGIPLPKAVMLCIPEAFERDGEMPSELRDFYQTYAALMEPWDGPCALLFSDGEVVGAALDRNGLRPCRYCTTRDGRLILSSETGALKIPEELIEKKDRLRPGKMLLVDTREGRLIPDEELKHRYAVERPYGNWLREHLISLRDWETPRTPPVQLDGLQTLHRAFGYQYEEVFSLLPQLVNTHSDPIGAMGSDIPLAVFSRRHPLLFDYLKQRFAQVTNPPIDAVREAFVTSCTVYLGSQGNLLEPCGEGCRVLRIENPILSKEDLYKIRENRVPGLRAVTVSTVYPLGQTLDAAMQGVFEQVRGAVKAGARLLILSDRGVDAGHLAIPSLLAVAGVSQFLVESRLRCAVSLIAETADARQVHHCAALLGYGACAVNPYLAQDTIVWLCRQGRIPAGEDQAVQAYNCAVRDSILKIASKMGVSTLQSYQGSRLFEAIGLSEAVTRRYFSATPSQVGGITLRELEEDLRALHQQGFASGFSQEKPALESGGNHRYRSGGQAHLFSPQAVRLLQQSAQTGDYGLFCQFSRMVEEENQGAMHLRSLLEFKYPDSGIELREVQSEQELVRHFKTGAMSYGSISREAHEALALAMNRLGARSNTGEGGEDPQRLYSPACSAVKQVASGRFGVTEEYLLSAGEIQIKMAQGAKPGEGGHLPGTKVYPWIAKTRHCTPGVGLISPPPHHDIYSIEDLAQLIYDLKNASPRAEISVKLVSQSGVGTVASGVAKAGAQVIVISGGDGGTGAAPITSIHGAGMPWELGLAQAHQELLANGLRSRVRLETDGKLLTGRDVAVAAILGAQEFSFATAPLVCLGCTMDRVCNLDTCPKGIATQNPRLRERFCDKAEYVENFMLFVARQLRELMARLGVRTLRELVGRTDLLRRRQTSSNPRAALVEVERLLYRPEEPQNREYVPGNGSGNLEQSLDSRVLLPAFATALRTGSRAWVSVAVHNTDRTVGTLLGSEVVRRFRNTLPEDTLVIDAQGSGGQSFGAFLPKGITLKLEGDCNDYLGKGLSGGKLVVRPPRRADLVPQENILVGNVVLYGATGGKAFLNGVAGERFCVRNSGACAVVEGVGNHGCEYMTGGVVVVLGTTGKNFAAGMSGGVAYVLDESGEFPSRLNRDLVTLRRIRRPEDVRVLRELIEEHTALTGSPLGNRVLREFRSLLPRFYQVIPREYERMLELIAKERELGADEDQARLRAFYLARGEAR